MPYLRLVIVWLIMLAMPLQGIAAGAMTFCNGSSHAAMDATAPHGHHGGTHAHGVSESDSDEGLGVHVLPGVDHECSACASCCMAAALVGQPRPCGVAVQPRAEPAGSVVQIRTVAVSLPDKPPRI